MRLTEASTAVRHRFGAMFDDRDADVADAGESLEAQLGFFEAEWILPWWLGVSAVGTLSAFERDPAEFARTEVEAEDLWLIGEMILWVRHLLPQPPDMSAPRPFADLDYEPGVREPQFADTGLRYGYAHQEPTTGPWV